MYDTTTNSTQLAEHSRKDVACLDVNRQQGNVPPTSATAIISNILKRFADFNPKPGDVFKNTRRPYVGPSLSLSLSV